MTREKIFVAIVSLINAPKFRELGAKDNFSRNGAAAQRKRRNAIWSRQALRRCVRNPYKRAAIVL
jgi:hypothetical protein